MIKLFNGKTLRISLIMMVLGILLLGITGCGGEKQLTYKDLEERIKNVQSQAAEEEKLNVARNEAVIQIDNYINVEKLEPHQKELIEKAKVSYKEKLNEATEAKLVGTLVRKSGSSCTGSTAESVDQARFDKAVDVYEIVFLYTIQADRYRVQPAPMQFYGFDNGFWSHLFNNFFTYPVGWVLWTISKLFGGLYVVGLIITTLLVRTLGWPIYAKTNDMSLKMQLMQPDLAKLEAKYENRKDPESQRAKQMEMAQLYRKYKVGLGGCLMPFLQFPIFMSVFRAVSRIPYTNGTVSNTANWTKDLNTTLFGIDLFKDRTQGGSWQMWGVIILAILVVATQITSQILMQARQKQTQQKSQEDIPAYRRQAVAQANDTQKTMKYMMYFMTIMMATFVLSSAAGLGFYWLIGNLYSMLQTLLNQNMNTKRMLKLKEEHGR